MISSHSEEATLRSLPAVHSAEPDPKIESMAYQGRGSHSPLSSYYRRREVPREPRDGDSVHIDVQTYRRIMYRRTDVSIFDRARGATRNRARSKYEIQNDIFSKRYARARAFLPARARVSFRNISYGVWPLMAAVLIPNRYLNSSRSTTIAHSP